MLMNKGFAARRLACHASGGAHAGIPAKLRVAVVGGGLAGVATSWHLLANAPAGRPIEVQLYEAAGLGAGGSGAAAGLLHGFNPRGKPLWQAEQAMQAALELVSAAQAAAPSHAAPFVWRQDLVRPCSTVKQAKDFAKAAAAATQAHAQGSCLSAEALSLDQLHALLPGICRTPHEQQQEQAAHPHTPQGAEEQRGLRTNRRQRRAAAASTTVSTSNTPTGQDLASPSSSSSSSAGSSSSVGGVSLDASACGGLLVRGGVVLDVGKYLHYLWRACEVKAAARADGSSAVLRLQQVHSLAGLQAEVGPFDAVVVATGAAAGVLPEVGNSLPLQLCQGYTLVMQPAITASSHSSPSTSTRSSSTPHSGSSTPVSGCSTYSALPAIATADSGGCSITSLDDEQLQGKATLSTGSDVYGAGGTAHLPVSVLGQPYLAAQGQHRIVVGATKRYGLGSEQALALCHVSQYAEAGEQHQQRHQRDQKGLWVHREEEQQELGQADQQQQQQQQQQCGSEASQGAGAPLHDDCTGLLESAQQLWAPLHQWETTRIRQGVRALPPRTLHGSLPLLGPLQPGTPYWLYVGLGSRGLVYHAWTAQLLARAILLGHAIPEELTAWQHVAKDAARFDAP